MIEILIVDDHLVVREGIKQFLSKSEDLRVTGEASGVGEALNLVRGKDWGLVLLDISLPDTDGLEGLRLLHREKPGLPILMFSSHAEEEYALVCIKEGAAGYLAKDCPPEDIRFAIRKAASGEKYIGNCLAKQLLCGSSEPAKDLPHERLTAKEFDILLRISRGQSLTNIGAELHLSVKTISSHRTQILSKMGMTTNADLTRYVVTHKIDLCKW